MVWDGGVGPGVHGRVPIVMVLAVTVVVIVVVTVVVSVPCAKEIKRAACRRARMVKTMLGSRYLLLR